MGDFCDWEPCSWLQKFVLSLLPKDRDLDTVQVEAFHRPSRVNGKAGEIRRVTFYYCPFCGTRLTGNKEILEWIQRKKNTQ
jgi:hypothetical protein